MRELDTSMGRQGALLGIGAALFFGASTPASKWLLAELGPFQLAGLLYLGAALATAPWPGRGSEREPGARIDAANRWRLVGAVVAGGLLGPVLLLFGLRVALAGSVSLLLNLEMAATAVLGVAFFGEHLGRRGWLGVVGVLAASALVSWEGGWPGVAAAALVAAACVCWALDNHFTAGIDAMSPARCTFWKGLVAGSANLSIGLALAPLGAGPGRVGFALAVGALSYGASIALYIRAAHQIGATRAQACFAAAPFLGAALSFAVLREPLGWEHAAGGLLLLASIAALLSSQHAHRHVHEALAHIHSHRHDDGHHQHAHEGLPQAARHSHWHSHEPQAHSHPHASDLHHRHSHGEER